MNDATLPDDAARAAADAIDQRWMTHARMLAARAAGEGEVPVGAVLIGPDGALLAEGWNRPIALHDPTAHAEIMAMRAGALALGNYRLTGTTLYVTLEPCAMCAGAIIHARVRRLVFGARDPRAGAVDSVYDLIARPQLNHAVQWCGGVQADACGEQLRDFFRSRRKAVARQPGGVDGTPPSSNIPSE